jgi:hypothetical protein
MRMTKEDVLAFRVGDRVHILKDHKNATIVGREEIHDEERKLVGIELSFGSDQARPGSQQNYDPSWLMSMATFVAHQALSEISVDWTTSRVSGSSTCTALRPRFVLP